MIQAVNVITVNVFLIAKITESENEISTNDCHETSNESDVCECRLVLIMKQPL